MFVGIGTVVNCFAVVFGGIFGLIFKKALKERFQQTMIKAMGVAVIFIGAAGALKRLFALASDKNETIHIVLMVVALALGAFVGELINIQGLTEKFGAFLKEKTGSSNDRDFIDGFVYASLTVCVGAMAVIGPIEDALNRDPSTLFTKAILDFVIIMVMASSKGKGTIFSALPLGVFQGSITLFAKLIEPLLNDLAVTNISFIGSMLIFCVGLNLLTDKQVIRVANVLPSLVFIVLFSYIPIN
ncbi:MAG: DUF554 domain-containing protein [Clostridia bacterium]|nr:DUF554 domain-containing protein [Clostridia bacterium]